MRDEKRVVTLNNYEQRLLVRGLSDFRNGAIRAGKPTEDLDGLLLKVIDAPTKREKRRNDRAGTDKFSKASLTLYACGTIPVIWIALLLAPYVDGGLVALIRYGGAALNDPFHIILCEDSLKAVLIFLTSYGLGIGIYLSADRNYRRREEHGSAKWGVPRQVNQKYADKNITENKILTQNVAIGLEWRRHRRNLNILVCGGSGAGKTRFFAKPNIMNANTSFVCLAPKGELLRDTGNCCGRRGMTLR